MKLLLCFLFVIPLTSFAASKETKSKTAKRTTASVDAEAYASNACGSLNRIRYENHGRKGDVVKLLIDETNIKFYKREVSYDDAVLAAALANKKIKVCYQPKESIDDIQFLDFYFE